MFSFTFPQDFVWGTAASSFQIEGAADVDGRGPSIWDVAARAYPEKFWNEESPDHAADFYYWFEEDIKSMKDLGIRSFRFSISWSRILPNGHGEINQKGIDFYNKVIDTLLSHGIEPFIDLYHWDLPQALADIGGFKNVKIIWYFKQYAKICFEQFGDRVRYWSTMNEPSVMAFSSYYHGAYPPFEKDLQGALLAAHHMILMHYEAVRMFRSLQLPGEIGAVIAFVPIYPDSHSDQDRLAATYQFDFVCDWWLQPIFKGTYPKALLELAEFRAQMPQGYEEELKAAFAEMDFVGLNYYNPARCCYEPDSLLKSKSVENFYAQTDYGFTVYPQGLSDMVNYMREVYGNPKMYITENGIGDDSVKLSPEALVEDKHRIDYLREHLRELSRTILNEGNVQGYFYWSNTDTYEATSGTRFRFGLIHVDYATRNRTMKKSWHYYREVIGHNAVD